METEIEKCHELLQRAHRQLSEAKEKLIDGRQWPTEEMNRIMRDIEEVVDIPEEDRWW